MLAWHACHTCLKSGNAVPVALHNNYVLIPNTSEPLALVLANQSNLTQSDVSYLAQVCSPRAVSVFLASSPEFLCTSKWVYGQQRGDLLNARAI